MAAATSSPSSTQRLIACSELISQGAEAKVYKAILHPPSTSHGTNGSQDAENTPYVLLKHRFHKHYRHPTLDATLTKSRVASEARALVKCLRAGVNVPGVRMLDSLEGVIGIEWIDGKSVRVLLGGGAEGEEEIELDHDDVQADDEAEAVTLEEPLVEFGITKDDLMQMIGSEIAKMHKAEVIHGDLTTSNMMLRRPSSTGRTGAEIVLIDFGLAYVSNLVEDKAVDLYVLERAFSSTHPASEPLFALVLQGYAAQAGKEWKAVKTRLDDVRLRGRKRSMVG